MSAAFSRTRQCKACPWRKSTIPERDIPGGYSPAKHAALTSCRSTRPGEPLRIMACHETPRGRESACVGWIANQLGPGNNIALRLRALRGDVPTPQVTGEQYETLEEMCARGER